ncbi:MAG TPA: hypothetical protein VLM85_18110 [Polyangiaceae bacterium]|nr:hypothetical protein [Polyangiaceae bacterium]
MTAGGCLRLRFYDDGDGTGKLVARAEANGFGGEGGAYFDKREVEDFATKLGAFPLPERTAIAGGFYSKERPGELGQVHLAIDCYPIDAKGHLGLRVRMSTERWAATRPDSQHSVALEILTTYAPLRRFSHALVALLRGDAEEAILEGE